MPLLVVGLLVLIKQRKSEWARVLVAWLLIGPLPATIGRDSPHTVRALNMLPALIIVLSLGLIEFMALAGRKIRNKLTLYLLPFTIYFVFLALYFYSYHFKYPAYAAKDWQYGYQQMARYVQKREAEFDKIIVSSQYGQPHIFVYFWQKRDPLEVFWGGMSKYVYRDINWEEDQYLENVLLVGTPRQIPLAAIPKWERDRIIKEIMFPDGSVAFRIIGE